MVIRTYFDRNNTIVANSIVNTGRNPITELYYGGGETDLSYSRFLFHFDTTRLRELYTGGTFVDISKLRHTLRMTNTGAFDQKLLGGDTPYVKQRTSSFDLVVFKINQNWDEGVGYDYVEYIVTGGQNVLSTWPSNWDEAQTNVPWNDGPGTYSGDPSPIIATQHFEQGNENIEMDITDIVNNYITGTENYGLGIAFPRSYEETNTDEYQYVGFFTRHTQTFYEPFVETVYDCHINDDRNNFYLDKDNLLYLYVNINGKPTNLDTLPSANVYDDCGVLFSSYTPNQIIHCTKGVYAIQLNVPTTAQYTDGLLFNDTWSGLIVNGIQRPNVELSFALKDSMGYYNIGDSDGLPKKVGFTVSGINSNEKIKRGDIRKVLISTRIPYTINQTQSVENLKYRLYVKEGRSEYTVIDYQPVEMTPNTNYFLLDTASLIPNIYYLDVRYESNQEISTTKDILRFEIVSLSELRISQ